ncbi:hypothetical protein DMC47_42305 [Nostoc sp. 3335mG]|nr:hypothetical protein DMC47_42305 [Nostoc sp. 3335mG]
MGRIEASGSGSLIVGHFRVAQPVKVFMALWFGGVTLFALAFIGTSIAQQSAPWMAVVPVGMLGFGICLVRFGTWMARDDRSAISTMLADTLIAREAS